MVNYNVPAPVEIYQVPVATVSPNPDQTYQPPVQSPVINSPNPDQTPVYTSVATASSNVVTHILINHTVLLAEEYMYNNNDGKYAQGVISCVRKPDDINSDKKMPNEETNTLTMLSFEEFCRHFEIHTVNYYTPILDAYIQYQFSEETQEALEHGIALQIDINLGVKQQRKWLWDRKIKSTTMSYRLEHHPLSGHYLVTNLNNDHRKHFQNLQGALSSLGLIKNFPLFKHDILIPDNVYIAQIKAKLNIHTLPAPLRLLAYLSSNWRLTSPWYEWIIQQ